jgi:hypothetical protein
MKLLPPYIGDGGGVDMSSLLVGARLGGVIGVGGGTVVQQ